MKQAETAADSRALLRPVLIGLAGIAALITSSYIAVPMYPVPVTLQTLVVLLLGAVMGPRAGAATVLAWLALSLTGAPVLADGKSGLVAFAGPTAGYLASFPVVAFLAGYLPKDDRIVSHVSRFAGFLALHAAILFAGWSWLSAWVGPEGALAAGVVPFLIGSVLKSGLATALVAAFPRKAG
ncbi:MAG: biotin transporter BioY [Hyphomonas sp.]